jgi:hypothetical protein
MHMRPSGASYWGNDVISEPGLLTPVERWACIEVMVKLNGVGSFDGEFALWMDGEKIAHLGPGFPNGLWSGNGFREDPLGSPFEGFAWRSVPELQVSWIWLNHYAPESNSPVFWDDVVVATEYIGPLSVGGSSPPPTPLGRPGRPFLVP